MVIHLEDHGLILFLTREKIHRTTVLKRVELAHTKTYCRRNTMGSI